MDAETMRRALELQSRAVAIRKQYDAYVLLKRDQKEFILCGDPVSYRKDEYHRMQVEIPESARRHVFNLWRKDVADKHDAIVRELNKIGMAHGLTKIEAKAVHP